MSDVATLQISSKLTLAVTDSIWVCAKTSGLLRRGVCGTLAYGLIGLIEYSFQQGIFFFRESIPKKRQS